MAADGDNSSTAEITQRIHAFVTKLETCPEFEQIAFRKAQGNPKMCFLYEGGRGNQLYQQLKIDRGLRGADDDFRRAWRFERADRVVTNLGDRWATGVVSALDVADMEQPGATLPYLVQLDQPKGKVIAVPWDGSGAIGYEVCFQPGEYKVQRELRTSTLVVDCGGAPTTGEVLCESCLRPSDKSKPLRFKVGDSVVACLQRGNFYVWRAAVVVELWSHHNSWAEGAVAPYRIELEGGGVAWVHRDSHVLLRDASMQLSGREQGLRARIKRRRHEDGTWQMVDYQTCKARKCSPPELQPSEGLEAARPEPAAPLQPLPNVPRFRRDILSLMSSEKDASEEGMCIRCS